MPVSRAAHKSYKAMLAELAKCVIACANCHRKDHAGLIDLSVYSTVIPQVQVDFAHLAGAGVQ